MMIHYGAEVRAEMAGGGEGEEGASSSSELNLKDRETARRNFKRVSSMQREQLGLGGSPLPDPALPEGITPDQLFPGEMPSPHLLCAKIFNTVSFTTDFTWPPSAHVHCQHHTQKRYVLM